MAHRNSMRHIAFITSLIIAVTLSVGPMTTVQAAPNGQLYLPMVSRGQVGEGNHLESSLTTPAQGELYQIVVAYSGELQAASTSDVMARFGANVVDVVPQLGAQVLEVPAEHAESAMNALASMPGVAYVEPNYVASGEYVPNDEDYAAKQYGPSLVKAEEAWDVTLGSERVVVAVLDSGADMEHPDLQGKLIPGYDYVNNDGDPSDDHGHGTHVTGIIGAAIGNGVGVAGVGGNVKVMVMKVLNHDNTGLYSSIAHAITDATDQGAHIINMSLGAPFPSRMLADAMKYAWDNNVLLVAAAGNNSVSDEFYPAAYPEVIGVTMTDWNDNYVSISNYGEWVALAAPGYGIYSTDWRGSGKAYGTRTGTSQATPHVAGVAALVLSIKEMTNVELRDILFKTADDKGTAGFDNYYGYGRVNAYEAVLAAGGRPQPANSPEPSTTPKPTGTVPPAETPEPKPTKTAEPQPVASVHVSDLDGVSRKAGKDWRAEVDVLVRDHADKPVAGATVSGTWSEGASSVVTCTTGDDGRCRLESGRVRSSEDELVFTIDSVRLDGYMYQANANHDAEADSNGTLIRIHK